MTDHVLAWDKDADINGTSLKGYLNTPWSFEESVARLASLSGQPVESSDMYKTSFEFVGTFDGEVFTLYDYKEDREIHVGGCDGLDVNGLRTMLLTLLERADPRPYFAPYYYQSEGQWHGWPLEDDSLRPF